MQTPFSDLDNAVLLSALEHYGYCPRQCALIHREQTYDENIFTLQSNAVHERVDPAGNGNKRRDTVGVQRTSLVGIAGSDWKGRPDRIQGRHALPGGVQARAVPGKQPRRPAALRGRRCAWKKC